MKAPILIRCEGSGARSPHSLCVMCGHTLESLGGNPPPEHNRQDILAMIDRGDFDQ